MRPPWRCSQRFLASEAYVIAGDNPKKLRADLNRPWRALAKRAGLEDVRIHDLRHTHASIGAGAGLGLPIIGSYLAIRSLNHCPICPP
jgi:integrase